MRYVEARFGVPAFVRRSAIRTKDPGLAAREPVVREQVYRMKHAWLQVLSDEHDAVVRFSVTVTDPRFRFRIRDLCNDQIDARLGHCRFADIQPQQDPDGRSLQIGARARSPLAGWSRYVTKRTISGQFSTVPLAG
jgi:hypothetical protein